MIYDITQRHNIVKWLLNHGYEIILRNLSARFDFIILYYQVIPGKTLILD